MHFDDWCENAIRLKRHESILGTLTQTCTNAHTHTQLQPSGSHKALMKPYSVVRWWSLLQNFLLFLESQWHRCYYSSTPHASGSISTSSWENKIIGNSPFKRVLIVVIVKYHERQNKCRYLLNAKYCVYAESDVFQASFPQSSSVFQNLWQTLIRHTASLVHMFVKYNKHKKVQQAVLYCGKNAHTQSCCHKW